jgi:predicted ATPase/class 3 adenylate cyclase
VTARLPTGTVTFLFTDIEASTRLLQTLGNRYSSILDEHHRLLRKVFTSFGGAEVSTEGDAFFVVFASAPAAARAAAAAQRALAAHDWGDGIELRVRMGLHTGDGVPVDDDYRGMDVHRAARIADAAHGGQVLVSGATHALVEPSLEAGARFASLGEHKLKDVERTEHLYQLCIKGLPETFPPPRTVEARRDHIPTLLTSFVARHRELREIKGLLHTARLVTLTGPGGTGKTRLALEVASEVMLRFAQGVFFVPLASVAEAHLVPSAVATVLGVRERGTAPVAQLLAEHLSDKQALLVLDNFEHVLDASPLVKELLMRAPGVRVLATSRAALRLSGEYEYPVPPMSLPDPGRPPPLDRLADYESVALFVARARSVAPGFAITEDNVAAVVEICRRLDGLPLAIELAAARVKLLTPSALVQRLDRALSLLTRGASDAPLRQRTLRDTVSWSYDLLDDPHRTLFRRLAIFSGGWSLEAAEAVCNPDGEIGLDVLDALEALVDHSLVRRAETDAGEGRFRMLQTIREFALELLEARGEADGLRRRMTSYLAAFAEEHGRAVMTDIGAIALVEAEHDNLRAALRYALDAGEPELGLRIGTVLWRFWMLRSHLAEGRRWLTELLALPGTEGTPLRGHALLALGGITYWQNEFEATHEHFGDAVETLRETNDRAGLSLALYNAAFPFILRNDAAAAATHLEEARALAEELGDDALLADTAWGLAISTLLQGDFEAADRLARSASERYERLGNWWGRLQARFVFFQVARYSGDFDEARRLITDVLPQLSALQGLETIAWVLESLSAVEVAQGYHERAVRLGGAAQGMKERLGGGAPPPLVEFQDPRELVRETLGAERIAELWEEGRAMSPEEGLAYARKPPST